MRLLFSRYWMLTATGMAVLSIVILGLIGCGSSDHSTTGSTTGSEGSLGTPLDDKDVQTVCTGCLSEDKIGQAVAVEGEIVQQCPASGCWFRLKDDAGEVFVDLASAKLRLTQDQVGQHAKVQGRLAKSGGKLRLEAQYVELAPSQKDTAPSRE